MVIWRSYKKSYYIQSSQTYSLAFGIIVIVNIHHVYKSFAPTSMNPKTVSNSDDWYFVKHCHINVDDLSLQCIENDMTLLEGSMYPLRRCWQNVDN